MSAGETVVGKGVYGGWRAETSLELNPGSNRRLDIRTSKDSSGYIVTYAGVATHKGNTVTTAIFKDFHKRVFHEVGRGTEKTIRDQHQRALALREQLRAEARAHEGTLA